VLVVEVLHKAADGLEDPDDPGEQTSLRLSHPAVTDSIPPPFLIPTDTSDQRFVSSPVFPSARKCIALTQPDLSVNVRSECRMGVRSPSRASAESDQLGNGFQVFRAAGGLLEVDQF
jgi:hypothetical protein